MGQNARVETVVLVVVLLVAIGLVVIAGVVVLLVVLRRASRRRGAELRETFPDAELGPELGMYRGGTGAFPRTRNTGWIVLTPTSVVVRPILGSELAIPTTEITGTRIGKSFRGHWNGQPVLVLETARGEIGVTVESPDRWRSALAR